MEREVIRVIRAALTERNRIFSENKTPFFLCLCAVHQSQTEHRPYPLLDVILTIIYELRVFLCDFVAVCPQRVYGKCNIHNIFFWTNTTKLALFQLEVIADTASAFSLAEKKEIILLLHRLLVCFAPLSLL